MANQPKNTKSKKKDEPEIGPRGPLLRSKDDRVVWGVAGGLAAHVGFNPILVRIAFVVTTLFGGAGLLAYLVLAVALPEDDGTGKPVAESVWARLGKVALVCILAAIALSAAAVLAVGSAYAAATGHGGAVAAVVILLGAALVAVAFASDLRRRIIPWVVAVALVLAIPAGAVAAADIDVDGSIGQREYKPTTAADLPTDGYELGIGQLIVDLRDLPWQNGQTVTATSHLGIGQMIVSVPSEVCIDGHATGKAGELIVGGDVSHGVDPEIDQGTPSSQAPRLVLDADIQLGQLIVTDESPDQIDTHGADYDHHQDEENAQRRVCGR